MPESTVTQVARLQRMSIGELRTEWERVFGRPTKQRYRAHLKRQLAKAIQGEEGPNPADDESKPASRRRTPPPGSVIAREYKGTEVFVKVLDDGFEYAGVWYRSLSAAARAITGYSSVNGYAFFGLTKGGRK